MYYQSSTVGSGPTKTFTITCKDGILTLNNSSVNSGKTGDANFNATASIYGLKLYITNSIN